jgi:hypothetical protein
MPVGRQAVIICLPGSFASGPVMMTGHYPLATAKLFKNRQK